MRPSTERAKDLSVHKRYAIANGITSGSYDLRNQSANSS